MMAGVAVRLTGKGVGMDERLLCNSCGWVLIWQAVVA